MNSKGARQSAPATTFQEPSVPPGVVVELAVEAPARAYVRASSLEEEERVLVDLVTRRCVACELAAAIEQLAQALLDRRAA